MRRRNQAEVARPEAGSKTEEGITVSAQQGAAGPNPHSPHPHCTDEEDRLSEVRNSLPVGKLPSG